MSCQPARSIVAIFDTISRTRRPRLLLRTARIGLQDYRRESDLRRVLRLPAAPPPGAATLHALIELEAGIEAARLRPAQASGEAWLPARHGEVMIALMAEAQLMTQTASAPRLPPRRLALTRVK